MMMAEQRIVFGGRMDAPRPRGNPPKPLPLFDTRAAPAPADAPAGGEEEALAAERDALIAKLAPIGRYSYRRRAIEAQLAAVTARLMALEIGR